jgi:hypothetical protein
MKKAKLLLALLPCMIALNLNAQLLQNIAKQAIAKGLNEGVNAALKNTTLRMYDGAFTFNLTTEKLYGSAVWQVLQGDGQFIKVYKDVKLQMNAGQLFRGNDYSFDIFIINDSCVGISHLITRSPYSNEYPNGPKVDIFKISDSTIYMIPVENVDSIPYFVKQSVNNLLSYPMVKFNNGIIYNLTDDAQNPDTLGTYKYFSPSKANFIFTSVYYKLKYKKISDQLDNEKIQSLNNYAAEWIKKEKECDHCSKFFTGPAVKIKSRNDCSTSMEYTGITISNSLPLFCSTKCAEKYCILLKQ